MGHFRLPGLIQPVAGDFVRGVVNRVHFYNRKNTCDQVQYKHHHKRFRQLSGYLEIRQGIPFLPAK
jgi:hypothetical protein